MIVLALAEMDQVQFAVCRGCQTQYSMRLDVAIALLQC